MGRQDAESETLIPTIGGGFDDVAPTLQAGGNSTGGDRPPGTTVDTCESLIPVTAHTLRADGFDASEDGTGRGTPLIPAIAFGCKDSDPARAMQHDGSHANAGGQVAVAIRMAQTGANGIGVDDGGAAYTLDGAQQAVAFHENQRAELTLSETAGTVKCAGGKPGQGYPAVMNGMQVRRLTPIECERLQGAEDDWTLVPNTKGKPMADGPRYKMLGNSFAVPVIAWIGRQIERAHHRALSEAA